VLSNLFTKVHLTADTESFANLEHIHDDR
jgi:hypothetical protein